MRTRFTFNFYVLLVLVLVCISCGASKFEGCLTKSVISTIEIVGQDGNPVSGVALTIVNVRTGKPLCEDDHGDTDESCLEELGESPVEKGTYTVVTSGNTAKFGGDVKDGDVIEVTGTKGDAQFTQEYTVLLDETNCHPAEIIGSKVITLDLEGESSG